MGQTKVPPGLILAGGRSSRMGANKALLPLNGKAVLRHVVDRLTPQVTSVSVNSSAAFPGFESLPVIEDSVAGQLGPLAGILTGMRHYAEASHYLTVPCDSPFFPKDLAERLIAACDSKEAIVIASSLGRRHPVFGLWPTALADDLEHSLVVEDNRRINAFLDRHHTVAVDFSPLQTGAGELDPFLNINTPEELTDAQAFAEALA
ncbi:molybdenum cofactor guanylyltransferase MobA [Neorhizobium sp. NCHU2750]|uniref:molybdenum cofactor guanylyltransferase MobA n=1 Tax=Neorhizobium sp. NCHU2750 TaxID=1825976 RepID=UPI000E74E103|nr:molybdopterin guanine dinucleotide biosynthesis protein A [Neorhizobium sp. NCHU2750]